MELDDEWTIKLEEPYLSEHNSWIEIPECFQVSEEWNGKSKQGIACASAIEIANLETSHKLSLNTTL